MPWTYVISDLNGEEVVATFYEKELQKTNQKEFRAEEVIEREKLINYMLIGTNLKVELDLFNYATKADLKNETGVDTFDFSKKN